MKLCYLPALAIGILMTASAQGWPGTASGRPRSVHMARHRIPQRLGTLGAGTALRYVRR